MILYLPGLLLLLQIAATLFMVGLVWFVQVVHYPLLKLVGEASFTEYERDHIRLTSWVVGPVMIVEAVTSLALFLVRPAGISYLQLGIGFVLLALIWIFTRYLQMPCHSILLQEYSAPCHRRLVATNWLRTAAWSLRGVLVLWMGSAAFLHAGVAGS